jgi:inorganic pyrophosphatase
MKKQSKQHRETWHVIIETPKGCRNKYKFDEETGRMKLSKVMPEGMMFPYDFGFIPDTQAEDGDPLDVLVLSDEPMFPGCEVECRLIGVIKAEQTEQGKTNRNDRLIAVAQASVLYASVQDIGDLEDAVLKQIEAFFTNYQKVRDIEFKVLERTGARGAREVVDQSLEKAA